MKGKILVIRGGAIGDFVLTLPAITALRENFPEAHLEILGYPHIVELAVSGGLADRAEAIESRALAGFFARGGDLAPALVEYFSEFDVIVSYLYDPDGIFQENIARCTTAQFIVGRHRPEEARGIPAAKVFLEPLERLAIFDPDSVPRLNVQPESGAKTGALALHPGSGSEQKNWPEENWSRLLEHLIFSTKLDLLLVGGEAEGGRLQRLAAALPPPRVRIYHNKPLVDLARVLRTCRGFIGHDSGISHLAAAVGLPCLLLWSNTIEAVWRPPSLRAKILKHLRGLAHLEPITVFEEMKSMFPDPE